MVDPLNLQHLLLKICKKGSNYDELALANEIPSIPEVGGKEREKNDRLPIRGDNFIAPVPDASCLGIMTVVDSHTTCVVRVACS